MTKLKLSIIVPVFNIEEYLHSCLDSILNQDFKNFELLLINDGSTDKSGEIVDKYALSDSRIKVFHQPNKGVSAARNLGLNKAKGEWICFVDGDDKISPNSLSALMKKAKNSNSQMIIAKSYAYEEEEIKKEKYIFDESFLDKSFAGYKLIIDKNYKRGSIWGCIFKHDFLKNNNLSFPLDLQNGEDSIFISLVHLYIQNISFIDEKFYLVNEREGSASRSWTSERVFKMTDNLTFLNQYIEDNINLSKEQLAIIDYTKYEVVSAIFNNLYYCFSVKMFFKIIKVLKKKLPNKINTLDIKISKSKIIFLNCSLLLFSLSVIAMQLFRENIKRDI